MVQKISYVKKGKLFVQILGVFVTPFAFSEHLHNSNVTKKFWKNLAIFFFAFTKNLLHKFESPEWF
jgi:hypothetical protein